MAEESIAHFLASKMSLSDVAALMELLFHMKGDNDSLPNGRRISDMEFHELKLELELNSLKSPNYIGFQESDQPAHRCKHFSARFHSDNTPSGPLKLFVVPEASVRRSDKTPQPNIYFHGGVFQNFTWNFQLFKCTSALGVDHSLEMVLEQPFSAAISGPYLVRPNGHRVSLISVAIDEVDGKIFLIHTRGWGTARVKAWDRLSHKPTELRKVLAEGVATWGLGPGGQDRTQLPWQG